MLYNTEQTRHWIATGFAGDFYQNTDWHHIVAGYDGQGFVYYDGELKVKQDFVGEFETGVGPMSIGKDETTYSAFYGKLDDIAFYDRALTTDEVAQIYCAQGGSC